MSYEGLPFSRPDGPLKASFRINAASVGFFIIRVAIWLFTLIVWGGSAWLIGNYALFIHPYSGESWSLLFVIVCLGGLLNLIPVLAAPRGRLFIFVLITLPLPLIAGIAAYMAAVVSSDILNAFALQQGKIFAWAGLGTELLFAVPFWLTAFMSVSRPEESTESPPH